MYNINIFRSKEVSNMAQHMQHHLGNKFESN